VVFLVLFAWRGGDMLRKVLVLWGMVFLGWIAGRSLSIRPLVVIIPEPFNTLLFLLVGLAFFIWLFVRQIRGKEPEEKKE